MEYSKLISDSEFNKYVGKHFNESWYNTVINSDKDGYYLNEHGEKKFFLNLENVFLVVTCRI